MRVRFFFVLVFLTISLVLYSVSATEGLRVTFFDVGQGDAIFFRTSWGYKGLIDGGPQKTILYHLGKEISFFERDLDVIILTHPHRDHIEGLLEVLERYHVSLVILTGVVYESPLYDSFLAKLREKSISLTFASSDRDIVFPDGTVLDILFPQQSLAGVHVENINSSSIVARLSYAGDSFLFTGDVSANEEAVLFNSPLFLNARVLKVAHHGSKMASSLGFLQAVSPKTAVISAGAKNRFGHPHAEVLERLEQLGIVVQRTDREGNVVAD